MVNQNKILSFKIKRQAKNVFLRDVERTVEDLFRIVAFPGNPHFVFDLAISKRQSKSP